MKVEVKPGKYVLAVSGGVDSMALMDLLAKNRNLDLIIAHFNHGIRDDSGKDEKLVRQKAKEYGLPFMAGYGHLGPNASEEEARNARYSFLHKVKSKAEADKIITAHHRDDLIETAFINILRGTGPKGLIAIFNPDILRPLTRYSKKQVLQYAKKHNLTWREDTTNLQTAYLRNYLRHKVLDKMSEEEKDQIIKNIDKVAKIRKSQERVIEIISQNVFHGDVIDRQKFIALPNEIAAELMAWRLRGKVEIDKKLLDRLVISIKTAPAGTKHNVKGHLWLEVGQSSASLLTG